jgi:RHS repeat-associated protein
MGDWKGQLLCPYNAANLVLTATDALSDVTTYTYDANGNVLTVTDANSKVTTYAYNNKDQLTSVTDAANGVTSFGYDAAGNLVSKTNPRGKTTAYTYDNLSRLASESDPLSHVRSYSYDAAGRLTSRTDAKSQAISYTYNDRNELTNITYPDQSYVSFAYNDAGARTQMVDSTGTTSYSYDSLYRLTSVTFPGSRTVSYGYDDAGRRTSITYPGGTNQATYAYDAANRLSSVTDWNSRAVAYAYDDAGRMTTATLPSSTGIVSSYSYDNADRLTGIAHVQNGSTTIASVSYTLDAVGNRTQRVDQQGTHTYAYDNLYRLTSVTYPGPATTSYAFDAFGNRTSLTDGTGTTTYAYDDAERLTSVTPPSPAPVVNYTWDNNGDLTARGSDSFAWDYEDRMTSATVNGVTTTFTYRGDGLRDSRTTGGNTTTFTWDVNRGLPVVLDDGNQYVYGAGLASMVTATGTYYYLADGLGSTMAIVDTSGAVQKSYTYDVYGTPTATGTLANEFDFAGQETDPTGLQYLRARYMDPGTGRFISRDALAVVPSWKNSPFNYVGARACNSSDPSGLIPIDSDGPGSGGGSSRCDSMWSGIKKAAEQLLKRAVEWMVGGNGQWDFSSGTWVRPSQEFRNGHYEAYRNDQTSLANRMWDYYNDDDCRNGPKPPDYGDYWHLGEYLLGRSLDQAANGIRNNDDWTQATLTKALVAAISVSVITSLAPWDVTTLTGLCPAPSYSGIGVTIC